jgi:hypothetical protein
MESESEGREDRRAIGARVTFDCLVEMLEAAASCDPMAGQQGQLRGTVHQAFQCIEPIVGRDPADGVHPDMDIERGEAFGAMLNLGDAFADLAPH